MSQATPWAAPTPPSQPPAGPQYVPAARTANAVSAWILLGAALATVLGSLLPWAVLSADVGPTLSRNIAGTEGDGRLTLLLGLVVGLVAVLAFLRPGQSRWAGVLSLVAGLAVLAVAIVDIADVRRLSGANSAGGLVDVDVGSGLWVTLVGGIAATAGSLVLLLAGRRRSFRLASLTIGTRLASACLGAPPHRP